MSTSQFPWTFPITFGDGGGDVEPVTSDASMEWVKETTFGTFPTNPTMISALIQNATVNIRGRHFEYQNITNDVTTGLPLQFAGSIKTGHDIDVSFEYIPQEWQLWKYAINSAGNGTTTKDGAPIAIGIGADSHFAKLSGLKIRNISCRITSDRLARCNISLDGAHIETSSSNPWSLTDYIGSGAHATVSSSPTPMSWVDVGVTWGGVVLPNSNIQGLEFGISNELWKAPSFATSFSTGYCNIYPVKRTFSVKVKVQKKLIDSLSDKAVLQTAQTLVVTMRGTTFTFSNAILAEDTFKPDAENYNFYDLNFVGMTDLVIA